MDPSESLDWYSGLHIVEEGEDAAAAAAAARAAEKQPEESISSVIGSAFVWVSYPFTFRIGPILHSTESLCKFALFENMHRSSFQTME